MKKVRIKKNNKIQKVIHSEKGITLIALVITIIVLIILAGISISLVLGENGLFNKAKSAATETAKARFLEDAGFAYSEAYIEKVETSNANDITIGDVVSKLKSSYGYTDEQIKKVSTGLGDITLSETNIRLKSGETKDITVTLENGTYYVLIEDLYYPITLSNEGITLGEGVKELSGGEETTDTIEAKVTSDNENDIIEVKIDGTTITITTKEGPKGKEGQVTETITVICGNISKEIKVTIIWEVKQGDTIPLGDVTVTVNDEQQTLAQGWKYFYDDKEHNKVWLIYSGTMEATVLQTSKTIKLSGNNVYSSSSRQDLLDYLNGEGSYLTVWDHIKAGIKNALETKGITIQDNEIEIKGTPDVPLFQKAYNQMYPDEKFEVQEVQGDNDTGWKYKFEETEDFKTEITGKGSYSTKPLFFINSRYWLASPSAARSNTVCGINGNTGAFSYYSYTYERSETKYYLGVRPVFSIPKTAFEQLVK